MSRVHTFKATLIGANKQQNVNFCLESAGISISESGDRRQVIANLAFPYIVKISRSSCGQGTPRILDISVHTKAGVQNLKVLLDSVKAADQLLHRFHKLAAAYKEREHSPSYGNSTKPVTPTFSRAGSFSRTQGTQDPPTNTRGNTVTFATAPVVSSAASPSIAVEQLPAASTLLGNSNGVELDSSELVHARQQIRFLESYVSRLTSRLAQMQQEQGKKLYMDADSDTEIAATSQADGSEELKWNQVQPLLTEYDEMIYTLQAKLSERQEELGRFEDKLGEISSENAQLVDKLTLSLKEVATMAVSEMSAPSEEHIKRVQLLHQENNVLTKQNAELDKEVARLNTDNESLAKQLLDATQQYGDSCVTLKHKDAEVMSMASTLNDLQSQARELEEQLAEEHVCRVDAQRTAADLDTLRQKHANLVAQHDVTVKCAEEASATAVALRAELDVSRADLAAASQEKDASNAASEELRKTVVAMRQELAEHRERDAEAVARIQDAKETLEQCKLAKQASEKRECQLQDEIAVLQKLYSEAHGKLTEVAAAASSDAEVATLKSELARIKQAYSSLEDTTAQVRNSNKKLEKEKWALHARLQESVQETPSADDLANLRRALDAERECESVKMQLESMKRTVKQHRLEDEVHVKKLEAQLEEANRTIASWTMSTVGTKQDALVLDKELESTRKELQTLSQSSARTEAQLRGEMANVRGEHSREVQMLVAKLEESVATYNTSVAEAERMMSAKEELLRKYKEESRVASSKLVSYQGIIDEKEAEIAALRSRLGRIQRDRDKFKADLVDAEAAAGFGRAAQKQAIKASREVADLQNRNEAESRMRRQLEMQLERTKLAADQETRRNGELNPIQAS